MKITKIFNTVKTYISTELCRCRYGTDAKWIRKFNIAIHDGDEEFSVPYVYSEHVVAAIRQICGKDAILASTMLYSFVEAYLNYYGITVTSTELPVRINAVVAEDCFKFIFGTKNSSIWQDGL